LGSNNKEGAHRDWKESNLDIDRQISSQEGNRREMDF
jgi:hypothetical protein